MPGPYWGERCDRRRGRFNGAGTSMNLPDIFVTVDQPDLWAARAQMALSLAWHIVIACFGVGLPLLVLVAEFRAKRGGGAVYDELAIAGRRSSASCSRSVRCRAPS